MKHLLNKLLLVFCVGCSQIEGVTDQKIFIPQHEETINTLIPSVGMGFDGEIHTTMIPTTMEKSKVMN